MYFALYYVFNIHKSKWRAKCGLKDYILIKFQFKEAQTATVTSVI